MSDTEKTKEMEGSCPYLASEDPPVTTLPEKTTDEANRRRLSKRQMIQVSCVCLLLLLIITIAFILILLFVPTRQIQINNTNQRVVGDRTVDEFEVIDDGNSLMQYLISSKKNEEQISVILDLNRNLEIMKISSDDTGSKICYVSPILALDPKFAPVDNGTNNGTTDMDSNDNSTNPSSVVNFKRSSFPIRDKSILGPKGVALCKDTEVYWSIPQCGKDNTNNQPGDPPSAPGGSRGRKRRAAEPSWKLSCFWDWTNCYFFSFPDQAYRNYYRCAITYKWEWY